MASEKQQPKSGPRCPDHPTAEVKVETKEVRTGYYQTIRKVMVVGKCQEFGCNRWCEIHWNHIMWS